MRFGAVIAGALGVFVVDCTLDVPPEGGFQLANQQGAIDRVAAFYGMPGAADPIYFVHHDEQCGPTGIFIHGGTGCVAAAWLPGQGDWLVLQPNETLYSQGGLCHEMMHMLIGDPGHMGPEWQEGGRVIQCVVNLANAPEVDVMSPAP